MNQLRIDNYIITEPIINILYHLQRILTNGKLREIRNGSDDIVVTCPHHSDGKERNADLNIYVGDSSTIPYGYAHCFACDFKGSFEKFVAECFDSSIDYAKQWLIQNYGTLDTEAIILDEPINLNKKSVKYLDESILDNYQAWTPYLAQRKLSRETCANFKVKYDPYLRQVIFPVYNIYGKLVMLARRNIDTKFFHMDKNVEKEVYGLNIIQKNNINKCIITEGPFDTLSGWEHNIPTVGTLGAVSDYQINQINKSCINVLYLGFDNDTAGRRFSELVKSKLNPRIITIDLELPADKKDLNDLSNDDWKKIIEKYF